jgi:hypothetical protein
MNTQPISPSTTQAAIQKSNKAFNSVQLNIVTFVDVAKMLRNDSAEGCVYMMDNNVNSQGQGTPNLQTVCKGGQTLNWIIYATDSNQLPDGSWPASVRINNLVFVENDRSETETLRVCDELKIYGGPDRINSKFTPVYYYWAGTVSPSIEGGIYNYRFVLQIDIPGQSKSLYYNFDTPSLLVLPQVPQDI